MQHTQLNERTNDIDMNDDMPSIFWIPLIQSIFTDEQRILILGIYDFWITSNDMHFDSTLISIAFQLAEDVRSRMSIIQISIQLWWIVDGQAAIISPPHFRVRSHLYAIFFFLETHSNFKLKF